MHTASIRKLALALSWSEQFFTLIYADYFWVQCEKCGLDQKSDSNFHLQIKEKSI